jgi:hypothetical protein
VKNNSNQSPLFGGDASDPQTVNPLPSGVTWLPAAAKEPIAPPVAAPPLEAPVAETPIAVAPTPKLAPRRTSMHPTALVFLEDPIARKLAVAWTACGGDDAHWLDSAGLSDNLEARRACKSLRANGICRDDGVTDDLALSYIQTVAMEPLKKRLQSQDNNNSKSGGRR